MIGTRQELVGFLMTAPDDARYELKEHKEKRSLNANSYYWVLLGKLAKVLHTSNTELHNQMLIDYGQYDRDESGNIVELAIKTAIPVKRVMQIVHVDPYRETGGYTLYRVLRGSHTYDTAEMSRLLEGLIQDCKDNDIETMTPDELERLKGYEAQAKYYDRRSHNGLSGRFPGE